MRTLLYTTLIVLVIVCNCYRCKSSITTPPHLKVSIHHHTMGNTNVAYAKSSEPSPGGFAPPPMSGLPPPPPMEKSAPTNTQAPAAASPLPADKKLSNPGLFAELHKKSKDVYPSPFEGLRVVLAKGLSNHLQVNHSLNLSALPNGTNYHFGATYLGGAATNPSEPFPILIGDVDNSGSLMAQMMHQLTSGIKSKCVVQTQGKEYAMVELGLDYKGDDCTAALSLGNIDVITGSGVVVGHYLQRISSLDLGAECVYHYSPGVEKALLSLGGRYSSDNWEMALQGSAMSWAASYYHKGSDFFEKGVEHKFGVNWDYNAMQQESTVQLGWEIDIPKAGSTVRGMIDSNWTVGSVFETKLHPFPFTFCLSGMINHLKHQCRFGFALQIGG